MITEKINIYRELRESTETDGRDALSQKELSAVFEKEGYTITQSTISKLETSLKDPPSMSIDVIKAYAEHFHVTADYLLGIRKTKPVDENLAMISKTTGFSEEALNALKQFPKELRDILSYMLEDGSISLMLGAVLLYFPNQFDAVEKNISDQFGYDFNRFLALERMRSVLDTVHSDFRILEIVVNQYGNDYLEKLYKVISEITPDFISRSDFDKWKKKLLEYRPKLDFKNL